MTDIANPNFLSPLNFRFSLKRAPHVNFFIQEVNLPGLNLPPVPTGNPLLKIMQPGDHLNYENLTIKFKVDEDLQNYLEVHKWLRALGKPSYAEYKDLYSKQAYTGESLRSDMVLSILNSSKSANYEVVFQDAFPINLSGLTFRTVETDVNYLEAEAAFSYIIYEINQIDG